jgi:cobalt-zinc-cadmium efflux system outer membrane protein
MGNTTVRTDLLRLLGLALIACLASGCIVSRSGLDQGWVADNLHERTGYRPDSAIPQPQSEMDLCVPPGVDGNDGLSEDEAIALALTNNTAFQALLAELGLSRADVLQARLIPNPTLELLLPATPKELESLTALPLDLIFFRSSRIAIAWRENARTAERLVQGGLDLVRDVRVAYSDLLLARDRLELARETAKARDRVAELARIRFRAGDVSRLDADTAQIEALNVGQLATGAGYDVALAEQRLRRLLGIPADLPLGVAEPSLPTIEINPEALIADCLLDRPDVRAAAWEVEAARQRLKLARLSRLGLRAGTDTKSGDGHGFQIGPAVFLTVPIFNQNQGQIRRAEAVLEQAQRQLQAEEDRAALEIRQAHVQLEQARRQLLTSQKTIVPAAEQAVARAEKAYRAGQTSLIFVLETTRLLLEARSREVQYRADLRRAWAELERSAGCRLSVARLHHEPAREGEAPVEPVKKARQEPRLPPVARQGPRTPRSAGASPSRTARVLPRSVLHNRPAFRGMDLLTPPAELAAPARAALAGAAGSSSVPQADTITPVPIRLNRGPTP